MLCIFHLFLPFSFGHPLLKDLLLNSCLVILGVWADFTNFNPRSFVSSCCSFLLFCLLSSFSGLALFNFSLVSLRLACRFSLIFCSFFSCPVFVHQPIEQVDSGSVIDECRGTERDITEHNSKVRKDFGILNPIRNSRAYCTKTKLMQIGFALRLSNVDNHSLHSNSTVDLSKQVSV